MKPNEIIVLVKHEGGIGYIKPTESQTAIIINLLADEDRKLTLNPAIEIQEDVFKKLINKKV